MANVNDILEFIQQLAPQSMKEEWDHVGLNCGHGKREVYKILVALDPFDAVCEEAVQAGADLLVTHHPLLWQPGFITDDTATGRRVMLLLENGIAHINAHTNLDFAPGGVNDVFAQKIGLSDVEVIDPAGKTEAGIAFGLLRCGYTEETPLADFLQHIKNCLGTPVLRFAQGCSHVHKVAVGGGSCGGALHLAHQAGCDTFITADVKYNQFWDARDLGMNIVDAGHFYTENPVCASLTKKLQEAFPEITVELSIKHTDCMEFA